MNLKSKLLFTDRSTLLILEALGKEIDKERYVIDSITKEYVLDVDGNAFGKDQLIGIIKGYWITNIFQLNTIKDL